MCLYLLVPDFVALQFCAVFGRNPHVLELGKLARLDLSQSVFLLLGPLSQFVALFQLLLAVLLPYLNQRSSAINIQISPNNSCGN